MDKITSAFLNKFKQSHQIDTNDESVEFEIFANYCIIGNLYDNDFEPATISSGGEGDCGLDGFAIIADDELITNQSELQNMFENRKKIFDFKFVFIQTKRSEKFESGEIAKFCMGVENIFNPSTEIERNERIKEILKMTDYVYNHSSRLKQNPDCIMYYITTGAWQEQKSAKARFEKTKRELEKSHLFNNVIINAWGAKELQKAYRNLTEANSSEVEIKYNVTLPTPSSIREAYLGFIEIPEYLKLITSELSGIKKSVFYSNVRDYQGDTDVNQEISATICNEPDNFLFYNNGVTIICKSIRRTSDKFTLNDYQIVNGCQTSHEIFKNKNKNITNIKIVIKLIVTDDEDTISNIIRATNRQTKISDEQFIALGEFHKELEDYYSTYAQPQNLYYERRHKQYEYQENIEKVRIVTIASQIKSFASMFLNNPHLACGYYGQLVKNVEKYLFLPTHKKIAYYTSAFLLYKLEYAFRNKQLERARRPFRYHILTLFKEEYIKSNSIDSKRVEKDCEELLRIVCNNTTFINKCKTYLKLIESCVPDIDEGDITKQASFVSHILSKLRETLK